MVKNLKEVDCEAELQETFKHFNPSGKGFTAQDLKRVAAEIGEKLSDEEINEMLKEADLDKDGLINYQEFLKMAK